MSKVQGERETGFQAKQEPKDRWTADLLRKHGLSPGASLEEIETKATELLGSPRTAIDGAELVLGRKVDARDEEATPIAGDPFLSGEDKFGLLLMQKAVEDAREERK